MFFLDDKHLWSSHIEHIGTLKLINTSFCVLTIILNKLGKSYFMICIPVYKTFTFLFLPTINMSIVHLFYLHTQRYTYKLNLNNLQLFLPCLLKQQKQGV